MFTKILIANRGAIATRIIRTLKDMGIESIAVYSEADSESLHVRNADHAFSLGTGPASDTYLNIDAIIAIAKQSGAQAIHPGYGFLSENAQFVSRCENEGLVFIGPTTEQLTAFGLKHTARQLAEDNNIPLLAGTGLLSSLEHALSQADEIGYPIMLKSTAGGGGIGMQVCNHSSDLEQAFASVKRLSANNFSNDGLFIEKYIEYARHIEVQVFGDGNGQAVSFGERDCSAQRRHQKVIEETPAPNIPDETRCELRQAATRLVSAVNYLNAGTVEFIYDQKTHEFYFLEVNTRLQVEHGVTEQLYSVDLVEWMIKQAASELGDIVQLREQLTASGHAIQVRLYAENPHRNFQPSAGVLSYVEFPSTQENTRIDHWIESGIEVSSFFDPMLAKIIVWSDTRESALLLLQEKIAATKVQGIETNLHYLAEVLKSAPMAAGNIYTRYLNSFNFIPNSIDVLAGGTMTTIQDYPGRTGHWDVGVPPSGPFDNQHFRLANRLLGNAVNAAGLEITLQGPKLQFNCPTFFVLTGADFNTTLDGKEIRFNRVYQASAGDILQIGKPQTGARAYLAIAGGIDGNDYLGSKSTFTLGQFGGFSGRALRTGDVINLPAAKKEYSPFSPNTKFTTNFNQTSGNDNSHWQLRVIYGPHGAPDFFTEKDIEMFFSNRWEVHYNSSRTGVRLIGPKPEWARSNGGEAGMHPSNIHDNAYAIGTVDFTGDMPVILGPDGPSLGGFVCPATVITADLWKLGQLKAGDKIEFIPVEIATAEALENHQTEYLSQLRSVPEPNYLPVKPLMSSPIIKRYRIGTEQLEVVCRVAGDKFLLVEYGPQELDLAVRFRVHALMTELKARDLSAILELTPGIRSLQIHYNNLELPLTELLILLEELEATLDAQTATEIPARIVHIPISWDDEACKLAIQKYMQSVRKDAPWCPDNIEFIRRINGLDDIADVKKIVFDASYVVMGLGDVYLGAPVATPLDPRHRLVTTKYNPARTWTAENSVGIGGAYLCVYGMEGPGGYQFIGRTLQMWNKYRRTREFTKPWLLRFFDQIRFYEVSAEELQDIRKKFPLGDYPIKIEDTRFNLAEYQQFLTDNKHDIESFTKSRNAAFDQELERWIESGQINFDSQVANTGNQEETLLDEHSTAVESPVAGSIWQWQVAAGDSVIEGQVICILESMKMEIDITAPCNGVLTSIIRDQGDQLHAGQMLGVVRHG